MSSDQALWVANGVGVILLIGTPLALRFLAWVSRKEIERDRARGVPVD